MVDTTSIQTLKALVEKKLMKNVLLKVIWNDQEKITLFITPNMKINSFIYDKKEGYIFFDNEGKQITQEIPCVLSEEIFVDGIILLNNQLKINGKSLQKEDKLFLSKSL